MNGGRVTSSVRALGAQRFIASFTPHEPGTHTVQITFNGEIVPGKDPYFNFKLLARKTENKENETEIYQQFYF